MAATSDKHKGYPYCHRSIGFNTTQSEKQCLKHLKALEIPYNLGILQKSALLATACMLRKVLYNVLVT